MAVSAGFSATMLGLLFLVICSLSLKESEFDVLCENQYMDYFETMGADSPSYQGIDFDEGALGNRSCPCGPEAYAYAISGLELSTNAISIHYGYFGFRGLFASHAEPFGHIRSIVRYVSSVAGDYITYIFSSAFTSPEPYYQLVLTRGHIDVLTTNLTFPYPHIGPGQEDVFILQNFEYGFIFKDETSERCLQPVVYDTISQATHPQPKICGTDVPAAGVMDNTIQFFSVPENPAEFSERYNDTLLDGVWDSFFRLLHFRWTEDLASLDAILPYPTETILLNDFNHDDIELVDHGHNDLCAVKAAAAEAWSSGPIEMHMTTKGCEDGGCPVEGKEETFAYMCPRIDLERKFFGRFGFFGVGFDVPGREDETEEERLGFYSGRFYVSLNSERNDVMKLKLHLDLPNEIKFEFNSKDSPDKSMALHYMLDIEEELGFKWTNTAKMQNSEFGFRVFPKENNGASSEICVRFFHFSISDQIVTSIGEEVCRIENQAGMIYSYSNEWDLDVYMSMWDEFTNPDCEIVLRTFRWVGGISKEFPMPEECTLQNCLAAWQIVAITFGTIGGVAIGVSIAIALIITLICVIKSLQAKKRGSPISTANLDGVTCELSSQKGRSTPGGGLDEVLERESRERQAQLNVNEKLFEINYDELEIAKTIGRGAQALVVRAKWRDLDVAFKIFNMHDFLDADMYAEFEREVQLLSSLHHPNVLRFWGASLGGQRVGMVLEYCDNGDLKKYFLGTDSSPAHLETSIDVRLRILSDIAKAMSFLHSRSVIHRDLKATNVLLDDQLVAKVMDFGVSRIASNSATKTQRVGTSCYMAPEVVSDFHYTNSVDVFSFGILIFEMLTNLFEKAYGDRPSFNVELKVSTDPNFRPQFPNPQDERNHPPSIVLIMRQCWQHEASDRPTFEEVSRVISAAQSGQQQQQVVTKQRPTPPRQGPPPPPSNRPRPPPSGRPRPPPSPPNRRPSNSSPSLPRRRPSGSLPSVPGTRPPSRPF